MSDHPVTSSLDGASLVQVPNQSEVSVNVPLCRPSFSQAEYASVHEVLDSGWLAHGPYNQRFEAAFAELLAVPHAITLNSCTSALELALKINDIKGEVICPSFTWVATANAIVTSGAKPVFCDVDEASRNVTAERIEPHITPQTEAVIVVHYAGQPCTMGPIVDLCHKHGLLLIEDSAETLGATYQGKQAGSFGLGCFSFFPTKNITTGEGGMLTLHTEEDDRKARALMGHGIVSSTYARETQQKDPWLRAADYAGHNYRMSNLLAALGYHQLQRLAELNAKRQAIAQRYNEAFTLLETQGVLKRPAVAEGCTHVYQMYTIQVSPQRRDEMLRSLRAEGVGASVHFAPPVHQQPFYQQYLKGQALDLPVTERLASSLMTLPIYPDMSEEDQNHVVSKVMACLA